MFGFVALCTFTVGAQTPDVPAPGPMQPPTWPSILPHEAPAPRAKGQPLVIDVGLEKAVRTAVYDHGIVIGTRFDRGLPFDEVGIPKSLKDAYVKRPKAVIELLLTIAEGGEPRDSMKAVAYAISLIDGPGVGVVVVSVFDRAKYDDIDPAWEETPRRHWIGKLNERIRKLEAKPAVPK